ncbi:hypothetical protein Pint_21885 [Pistacia integerrima]|uniref:Uncharacterized protein n=1 Tax=Pistacia integerrima TaxID=434235 RepID=A0ACC0XBH2_9ROSI|nr:hypothetical protein Pint_21885 [Pistacia integerrima]
MGVVSRRVSCRYEKLREEDDHEVKCQWVKKINGGLKGLRLSHSRKLTLKPLPVVLFSSKIGRIYAEIVQRLKMDDLCPSIIFSTHWGLPVLSHPSLNKCSRSSVIF